MGHSHLDGAHTHGSSGTSDFFDGLAQVIAVIALGVAAIDVVMWVLHILILIATGIGFLVLCSGAGFAAVKYRQFRNRRYQSWAQVYPPQRSSPVGPYWQHQPPALPPGGDVHLHLPPGMTSDDIAQIMGAQRRALPSRTRPEWGDGW
jgi:hypothetical protein